MVRVLRSEARASGTDIPPLLKLKGPGNGTVCGRCRGQRRADAHGSHVVVKLPAALQACHIGIAAL